MTGNKFNILYIDDEESNLRIFKNTFRRDFNIFLANSARSGIDILYKNKIDVLITDQRMPGMTGLDLLKKIHELFPDIPPHRLMISGYAAPNDIDTAFKEYGLFRFIPKPWDNENLKQIILKVINMHHE
ncbi:MAG: response regulator [Bacteroidales bacterium]|nr:response regulator [Bacteroidales bacterium]MBN2763750.1 response regulator [Bacteroidales bacterium]